MTEGTGHELARRLDVLPDYPVICTMEDDTGRLVAKRVEAAVTCIVNGQSFIEVGGRMVLDDRGQVVDRLREAEAIIRAQNRLQQAMYDSDLEVSWPREAGELQAAYEERYGVSLDGERT